MSARNRARFSLFATTASHASVAWYETFGEKMQLPINDFACGYLSRTGYLDDKKLSQVVRRPIGEYGAEHTKPRSHRGLHQIIRSSKI